MASGHNGAYMTPTLRIFLLEPDSGDLLLAQEALSRHPTVDVVSYQCAAETLRALRDPGLILPHLIVMEPHLPQESGTDLIRTVKNDPRLRVIPLIALSSVDDAEEVALSYSLGVSSYVLKPSTYRDFEVRLDAMLNFWQFAGRHLPVAQ